MRGYGIVSFLISVFIFLSKLSSRIVFSNRSDGRGPRKWIAVCRTEVVHKAGTRSADDAFTSETESVDGSGGRIASCESH